MNLYLPIQVDRGLFAFHVNKYKDGPDRYIIFISENIWQKNTTAPTVVPKWKTLSNR